MHKLFLIDIDNFLLERNTNTLRLDISLSQAWFNSKKVTKLIYDETHQKFNLVHIKIAKTTGKPTFN